MSRATRSSPGSRSASRASASSPACRSPSSPRSLSGSRYPRYRVRPSRRPQRRLRDGAAPRLPREPRGRARGVAGPARRARGGNSLPARSCSCSRAPPVREPLAELPAAVDPRSAEPAPAPAPGPSQHRRGRPGAPTPTLLAAVAAAMSLVDAYRTHGLLAARLDPLGSEPIGDPELDPLRSPPLPPELQARSPPSCSACTSPPRRSPRRCPCSRRRTAGRSRTRSSTSPTTRSGVAALGDRVGPVPPAALRRGEAVAPRAAVDVEAFEEYLRRSFLGQKQFSIEGLDALVPMLDESIEFAARQGAHGVVMGMAHRGRLSVLAHTLGQPYEAILREFEGERARRGRRQPRGRHRRREVPPRRGGRPETRRARSRSRSSPTRATSRPSTLSSRAGRARSRPTARPPPAATARPSRCRSSSTVMPRLRARASSPRRSTSRGFPATRPAARCI